MTHDAFEALQARGLFPETPPRPATTPEAVETHISLLLLTPAHVYKMKKPLQFSFLDFSSLAQRRYYCEEELRLNRRLAPEMYLAVQPVYQAGTQYQIGGPPPESAEVIDYALQMRRMDRSREMDQCLAAGQVTGQHLSAIAQRLARFHAEAAVVAQPFDAAQYHNEFADLGQQAPTAEQHLGPAARATIEQALDRAAAFLAEADVQTHLSWRHDAGLIRDGHGDLHSGNIFLTDPPVIFDCIEFNAEFRRIDLLSEIAFLAMDLEARGAPALAAHFYTAYLEAMQPRLPAGSLTGALPQRLFQYYKAYRANVRAKVSLLGAAGAEEAAHYEKQRRAAQQYLDLLSQYAAAAF
jgi:aminoglycoside phosphotransferase family enzyme